TARPSVGQSGLQEYYKGHAQDHFAVISTRARVSVPFISSSRAVLTKEWTPLEPGTLDHKYYVRGIGTVKEVTVKGPLERDVLVSMRKPKGYPQNVTQVAILVVDDNAPIRRLLERTPAAQGNLVSSSSDGGSAKASAHEPA